MTDAQTPQPYPPAPAVPTANPAGTAALVIGIVLVGFGVAQQVLGFLVPLWRDVLGGYAQVGLVFTALSIGTGALAIVGVVVGVIGIQPSRPRGRLAAAAGLALAAAHVLGTVVGFVLPPLIGLFL